MVKHFPSKHQGPKLRVSLFQLTITMLDVGSMIIGPIALGKWQLMIAGARSREKLLPCGWEAKQKKRKGLRSYCPPQGHTLNNLKTSH
jgi:hypothetical protein